MLEVCFSAHPNIQYRANIKKPHPYADSNLKGWDFLNFLLF